MYSLFRNTLVFVIGYVILMIPTYVLPWLGSNSAVLNAVGVAIGHGMTPQWWLHAWCLVMLILMAWSRGDFIGKKYLPVFPFLAAVFDLTPGLSMIPLIPTALHLAAIIIGANVSKQQPIADEVLVSGVSISRKAGILAGLMTAAAILGSALFISTSKKNLSEFAEQKSGMTAKSAPEKSETHSNVAEPTSLKKTDVPLMSHSDSGKHTGNSGVKPAQEKVANGNRNVTKEPSKVRYINLNE